MELQHWNTFEEIVKEYEARGGEFALVVRIMQEEMDRRLEEASQIDELDPYILANDCMNRDIAKCLGELLQELVSVRGVKAMRRAFAKFEEDVEWCNPDTSVLEACGGLLESIRKVGREV